MDDAFRHSGVSVPKPIVSGALALIDRLQQPGDGLCHGDIHPENVIMTADGPRLIDWTFSIRAPAALDHGFTHISLTELPSTSPTIRSGRLRSMRQRNPNTRGCLANR